MRLKTFHGKSMKAVMDLVRGELGPDAIIIQIDEGKAGVRVTAALEAGATPPPPSKAPEPERTPLSLDTQDSPVPTTREFDKADVNAVLSHHGIPFDTASRLNEAIRAMDAPSLTDAFSAALETTLHFSPLTDLATRPVMLVGPPGAGKTICAAKLAADALLHKRPLHLISTDTVKAAGIQQLDHFAQLMKQTVSTADTPRELEAVIAAKHQPNGLTVIDTPGTNPFNMQDLEELLKFIQAVDAEPVLVMPAGLDPIDAQEISSIFSRMGCQRFIATRLDAARRYGGIIMAARPGHLSLAALSRSPYVAEGLETATPYGLARLITALATRRTEAPKTDKAS